MVIKSAELSLVVGLRNQLPNNVDKIEVAFAGKSNVGKSSLINSLMNRKALARTSGQPGKTQTLNFYLVNDTIYLVDLPGYGYAKVSRESQEKWGDFIDAFLKNSKQIKAVFLLVDIRHEPSENDVQMYEWIKYHGFRPIVIATKMDKLNRSQIQKHVNIIKKKLEMEKDEIVIPFSSSTKQGRDDIWNVIDGLIDMYHVQEE